MTVIALHLPDMIPQWWLDTLAEGLPECILKRWPKEIGDKSEVDYVITLKPEPNSLSDYPSLKAIFATSAGVDHFIEDNTLPVSIPLCRLTNPELSARMSEYVLLHVLRFHRHLAEYQNLQSEKKWSPIQQKAASDSTVGIMGLGALGLDAAQKLRTVGFKVHSWSQSQKHEEGIKSYFGDDQLSGFLNTSDYLVCFLPLTDKTRGILNRKTLAELPDGAIVINVGRGACLVETDIITALDDGKLAGAVLDVFGTEPLPAEHPFWKHPKVTVTPHVSTVTHPRMLGPYIRENIARIEGGQIPLNVIDRLNGY